MLGGNLGSLLYGDVSMMRSFVKYLRCLKLLNLFNRLAIMEDKEGKYFFVYLYNNAFPLWVPMVK